MLEVLSRGGIMSSKRNLLQEIAMKDLLSTREEKIVKLVVQEFS